MSPLRPIIALLAGWDRRARARLEADLAERDPAYAALRAGETDLNALDALWAETDIFRAAHPDYDQVLYRRLRWKLQSLDHRLWLAGVRARVRLGIPSRSRIWHAMHTSTETHVHWQCPDCDALGRCADPDPDHLCTAALIFDVTEVDRDEHGPVTCHFCGMDAPTA